MAGFAVLGAGLLVVPAGHMGPFWPGGGPFLTVGGLVGCVRGRGLGARAHRFPGFILLGGFGGALLVVLVLAPFAVLGGGVIGGSCGLGGPFRAVGGLMGCARGPGPPQMLGARAVHLPRFILLGSFGDTLLVVSILDIAYDCHL